jgi:hypothetical protein
MGTSKGSYLKGSSFNVLYKSNWDGIHSTGSIGLSLAGPGGPTNFNRVSEVRISRFESGIKLGGTHPVMNNAITNFNINNVEHQGISQHQNASSNLVYRGVISAVDDGDGITVSDGTGLKVSHVTVIGATLAVLRFLAHLPERNCINFLSPMRNGVLTLALMTRLLTCGFHSLPGSQRASIPFGVATA